MTKRNLCVFSLSLLSLGSFLGCQPTQQASVGYAAPSFEVPRMLAAPAAPLERIPTRVYIAPRIAEVPRSKPSVVAPPMAGIPMAWVPPVTPRPWCWIVVHHSATTTGGAAAFDKMHRAKGWDELGYDFVIGNGTDTGNGQIEVGSRWVKQKIGAHAKTSDNRFNEYGIGICLVGNFDAERPTPEQIRSLDKLVAYLMVTYHITPDNILRHKDTKATDCPGRYLNIELVKRQAALLAGASMTSPRISASTELLTNVSNRD